MQCACKNLDSNPLLQQVIHKEGPLKGLLIQYVGDLYNPKDDQVTVEMIVEAVAAEFPEFLMVVAEENFLRGYEQALDDISNLDKSYSAESDQPPLQLVTSNDEQE